MTLQKRDNSPLKVGYFKGEKINKHLISGSVLGSKGNVGQSVYSASKAGVEGFTKSLAKEVASKGITANVIAPGIIISVHDTAIHRTCNTNQ